MYRQLKLILRSLIPVRLLYYLEPVIRKSLYFFYQGNAYQCNVCGAKLRKFILLENNERLCTNCGSLPRTRRIYQILQNNWLVPGVRILDFSPSRSLFRKLKKTASIEYVASDLSGDFLADKKYDITQIEVNDASFDLVICYHVLEHIPDDRKAIQELYRILDRGGKCLIQTPFKEGDIYENPSITLPNERIRHFGQKDHVRIYSVNGLVKRLEKAGFQVEKLSFEEEYNNPNGFSEKEVVLDCKK
ncbi:MAG: class I SAM-dependent methyltransferase [Bacteroidetes bacterium]|nr:MAG: class I SAM-dependent methyltransferase [Bacteroidota bacterium]